MGKTLPTPFLSTSGLSNNNSIYNLLNRTRGTMLSAMQKHATSDLLSLQLLYVEGTIIIPVL